MMTRHGEAILMLVGQASRRTFIAGLGGAAASGASIGTSVLCRSPAPHFSWCIIGDP